MGTNYQSHFVDERHDFIELFGAETFRLQLHEFLQRRSQCPISRRRRKFSNTKFHDAGTEIQTTLWRMGFDFVGDGVDFWDGWIATYFDSLLHCAGCENCADQRRLGDGDYWCLLYFDDVSGLRSRDDCRARFHCEKRRYKYERSAFSTSDCR